MYIAHYFLMAQTSRGRSREGRRVGGLGPRGGGWARRVNNKLQHDF